MCIDCFLYSPLSDCWNIGSYVGEIQWRKCSRLPGTAKFPLVLVKTYHTVNEQELTDNHMKLKEELTENQSKIGMATHSQLPITDKYRSIPFD